MPASEDAIRLYNEMRDWAIEYDLASAGFHLPPVVPANPTAAIIQSWTNKLDADIKAWEARNEAPQAA